MFTVITAFLSPNNLLCGCCFQSKSLGLGGPYLHIREGTELWSIKNPGHSTTSLNLPGLNRIQMVIFFFLFLIRAAGFLRQSWKQMPQRVLLYPPTPRSSRGGPHQYSQHLAHPKCTYVSLGRSRHLVSSAVKDPQETLVPSLGWEDPLQEGVATCSSIMAWEISSAEEPGGLQSMRLSRVRQDLEAKQQQVTLLSCTKCCVDIISHH